ncbi:MAG: hypothetical protein M5U29_09030 [Anaerolineae bacterium]|nr:hypothetical protein [Anaerolineae bacterium]
MDWAPYRRLAARLDALPNGFPPTEEGIELRLLAKLYTPEQAALAAELRLTRGDARPGRGAHWRRCGDDCGAAGGASQRAVDRQGA